MTNMREVTKALEETAVTSKTQVWLPSLVTSEILRQNQGSNCHAPEKSALY